MGKRANPLTTRQVDRPAKAKQARRARPGQRAPARTASAARRILSTERLSGEQLRAYQPLVERKAREHQHWTDSRPFLVDSLRIHAQQLQQQRQGLCSYLVSQIEQNSLPAVQTSHVCLTAGPTFTQIGTSPVRLQYFNFAAVIHIPTYACDGCGEHVQPDAIACGCFPSSPVQASVWVHISVLQFFIPLSLSSGLAATGERLTSSQWKADWNCCICRTLSSRIFSSILPW